MDTTAAGMDVETIDWRGIEAAGWMEGGGEQDGPTHRCPHGDVGGQLTVTHIISQLTVIMHVWSCSIGTDEAHILIVSARAHGRLRSQSTGSRLSVAAALNQFVCLRLRVIWLPVMSDAHGQLCFRAPCQVHPSLIVNMDQTGMRLCPSDSMTYETRGSKDVKVIGGEDKRQITVCVASSMDGDLLPLQLVFAGKTTQCLPQLSPSAAAAAVHLTFSDNHWSSQKTMREWVQHVLLPYARCQIARHQLTDAAAHIILVLDVWAVHKSAEFREFIKEHHPNIHLVYVPANCTSKLQVADVILQRPFKHGVKQRFNEWAASVISQQIHEQSIIGLTPHLKMKKIKPLILEWCVASWTKQCEGRQYIKMGWHACCLVLLNVLDVQVRQAAVKEYNRDQELLVLNHIPEGEETAAVPEPAEEPESDSEDEKAGVLDIMHEIAIGMRRSSRSKLAIKRLGFALNSTQIDMGESGSDSDANGMDC